MIAWLLKNPMIALSAALGVVIAGLSVWILYQNLDIAHKEAVIESQKTEIADQKAKIKSFEAGELALREQMLKLAEIKNNSQIVNKYITNLPKETVEVLESEKIRNLNHCLFGYFTSGMLPKDCNLGTSVPVPDKAKH
jgi:hypothetical protein